MHMHKYNYVCTHEWKYTKILVEIFQSVSLMGDFNFFKCVFGLSN